LIQSHAINKQQYPAASANLLSTVENLPVPTSFTDINGLISSSPEVVYVSWTNLKILINCLKCQWRQKSETTKFYESLSKVIETLSERKTHIQT